MTLLTSPTLLFPAACARDVVDAASPCSKVNYLRWDLSAQQIQALTKELIEQTKCVYDRVGAQDFEEVSYESTLKALADVEVTYTGELGDEWEAGRQVGGRSQLSCPVLPELPSRPRLSLFSFF